MKTQTKSGRFKKHFFTIITTLIVFVTALAISLGLLQTTDVEELKSIDAKLDDLSITFAAVRISLFVALIWFWREIMGFLANIYEWSQVKKERVLNLRWRIALWIAAFEIFIGQNLLAEIFSLL